MKLQEAIVKYKTIYSEIKTKLIHRQQKRKIKHSETKKYNLHNNIISECSTILRFVRINQNQTTTDEGK